MDDLLQKQIRDSCKLALPDGLADLMSDISREVLREQPQNLLQFITDYLSALLVARENLFIASRVCDDVCKSSCYPELEDELREVGLSDEDVEKTVKVVTEFFKSGGVKETNFLIKLLKKTEINETQLPAVLEAVRGAFLRHQVNNTLLYESSSTDSELDETLIAAKHTLKIYRKTKEPGDNYNNVIEKVQAAYRAYNVRRKFQRHHREKGASPSNKKADATKKPIYFDSKKVEQLFPGTPKKRCSSKALSISLAGSFVTLPPYKPYSIDDICEDDEVSGKEQEHISFDYTEHWKTSPEWHAPDDKKKDMSMKKKNISFHDLPQILKTNSEDATDEVPEEVVEEDDEFEEVDEEVIQEQLIKDHRMWPDHDIEKNKDVIIDEELIKDQVIHESISYEHDTETKEKNAETEIREGNVIYEELTDEPVITEQIVDERMTMSNDAIEPMVENAETDIRENDVIYGELPDEPVITEQIVDERVTMSGDAIEPMVENAEIKISDGDDIIYEELTNEPVITGQIVDKRGTWPGNAIEPIEENVETKNKDCGHIITEELVNEPEVGRKNINDAMIWYGDGIERMREYSESESRDGDVDIVEYLHNESAAASFNDLT